MTTFSGKSGKILPLFFRKISEITFLTTFFLTTFFSSKNTLARGWAPVRLPGWWPSPETRCRRKTVFCTFLTVLARKSTQEAGQCRGHPGRYRGPSHARWTGRGRLRARPGPGGDSQGVRGRFPDLWRRCTGRLDAVTGLNGARLADPGPAGCCGWTSAASSWRRWRACSTPPDAFSEEGCRRLRAPSRRHLIAADILDSAGNLLFESEP